MKYSLLVASVLAIGACAHQTGVSPQEMAAPDSPDTQLPAELAAIHPAYITAWTATDPMALHTYFGDEVTVITPTATYTGWTPVSTSWITPLLSEHYAIAPIRFTRTGDHSIEESGTYLYTMDHNGMPMQMKGTYTYHWKKQPDGSWRIVSVALK